jgi:hypothetical protein
VRSDRCFLKKTPAKVPDFFGYKQYKRDKGGEVDVNAGNGKQKSDGILLRG